MVVGSSDFNYSNPDNPPENGLISSVNGEECDPGGNVDRWGEGEE